jgi:pyruvate dehydrogenase E2 component (dihydrolipoamide acetyltransferase)
LRRGVDNAISLTLSREVEADHLVAARGELSDRLGVSLSYDAFFVKFLAEGLTERPELNSIIDNGDRVIFDEVHIGVAMAQSDGLIVPVVRHADQSSLSSVAKRISELKASLRSNCLRADDLTGATSTISNLGRFGVDGFTPVLNPPQSTILGIGRIQQRAVVRGDQLVPAQTCVLSLTFDHRVADGVPAAQMLDLIAMRMTDEKYLRSLT